MLRVQHLGDGAYISETTCGGFIITANHHNPEEATDCVHIDGYAAKNLIHFLTQGEPK